MANHIPCENKYSFRIVNTLKGQVTNGNTGAWQATRSTNTNLRPNKYKNANSLSTDAWCPENTKCIFTNYIPLNYFSNKLISHEYRSVQRYLSNV